MEIFSSQMRSAALAWERILAEHPRDLFALKCAQNAYVFVNDPAALRDVAARVVGCGFLQQALKADPTVQRFYFWPKNFI
jgi:hypothetical protein